MSTTPKTPTALDVPAGSVDDERHTIRSGMWDLIYTEDGWELENQHSYTCHKLAGITHGSSRVDAMRAARKLARELDGRSSPNTPVTDAEPSTPANTRAQSPRSV